MYDKKVKLTSQFDFANTARQQEWNTLTFSTAKIQPINRSKSLIIT